ncbi:MAG TPA: TorF family putative porin [Gammaproteobacteria bacterium]|nr:TorF family putative porin [Gammaproteobacteria bacterium]
MNRSPLISLAALAAGLAMPAAAAPRAAGPSLGAYATLTTDYRSRGLSQSDGGPALQAGLDYQHASGFFTGVLASTVDYQVEVPRDANRKSEAEVYAGYQWRSPKWTATSAAARYVYPGASTYYDYNEISTGFGYRERVFFTMSYTDALLSVGPPLFDAETTFAVPLPLGIELGGTLGRVVSDAYDGGRYTHWNAGVSRPFGRMGLDIRFYDNDAEGYGLYGKPLPDRWVLSFSYGFSRR